MLFTYVKLNDDNIKACIREEIISCKPIDFVSVAVKYESLDMMITYLQEKVASLEKSLRNNKLSEEEKSGIRSKIEKFNGEISKNKNRMATLKPRWEYVIETIASARNEYEQNNACAVRNVLRLTACQENSKFYKYVVVNGTDNVKLYEAMERIHQIEGRNIDDVGRIIESDTEYKDYVFSADEIGKIARGLFSIPIESELTKKVKVKFNKTDLSYIHSLYVRSLSVRFSTNKDNKTTYGGRVLRTLVKHTKDKDGIDIYDFTMFYEIIAKLAIEYIVK